MTDHINSLRSLRLWHWKRALAHRRSADTYRAGTTRYAKEQTARNDCRANFHIGAVQLLNDYVSGTAEEDCRNARHA
jgi:hypothetical protein